MSDANVSLASYTFKNPKINIEMCDHNLYAVNISEVLLMLDDDDIEKLLIELLKKKRMENITEVLKALKENPAECKIYDYENPEFYIDVNSFEWEQSDDKIYCRFKEDK